MHERGIYEGRCACCNKGSTNTIYLQKENETQKAGEMGCFALLCFALCLDCRKKKKPIDGDRIVYTKI